MHERSRRWRQWNLTVVLILSVWLSTYSLKHGQRTSFLFKGCPYASDHHSLSPGLQWGDEGFGGGGRPSDSPPGGFVSPALQLVHLFMGVIT